MIRWSRACSALLLLGCGARATAVESASALPEEERRAPGVAIDPQAALPAPADHAQSQQGLVVLAAPSDPNVARETVRQFFDAVSREANDELDRLVAPDAWVETGSQRQPVRAFWRARFAQLDYGVLAREVVYRESELETFKPRDLQRMGENRPTFVEPRDGDLVVRARIRASWKGRSRLFGDELVFLLRPAGSRFVITEISEDFRLP